MNVRVPHCVRKCIAHTRRYTIWFRHYLREHLAAIAPWMKSG
jgi:hypothetical protein